MQVIALTSFKEEELVQAVLHTGAIGYLLKNVSAESLVEAIHSAAQRASHIGAGSDRRANSRRYLFRPAAAWI